MRYDSWSASKLLFLTLHSQQIAAQTAQSTSPFEARAHCAPEPRDIVWTNMTLSTGQVRFRELFVLGCMVLIFFFWIFPINALAILLSYKEITKVMPWLGRLIDRNERVRAIVQNSLPSVGMISLNAVIPFLLEGGFASFMFQRSITDLVVASPGLTYVQGYRARSVVEYSLMKKCVYVDRMLVLPNVARQILPVSPGERGLHLFACLDVLATCPRPGQLASENSGTDCFGAVEGRR
jgi:hypothetical protein